MMRKLLPRETPWPAPHRDDCEFYHSMTFGDGEVCLGPWDIRGQFDQYVGHYPLRGKTVLDVGTATGFLAFSAESAGAVVTALDARDAAEFDRLPFAGDLFHVDRPAWDDIHNQKLRRLKNSFWYSRHKHNSDVSVSYTPLAELPYFEEVFDVVIAGAVVEHLADPISAIAICCRKAREAVVIPFTPIGLERGMVMAAQNPWTSLVYAFGWWTPTEDLVRHVLSNVGFDLTLMPSSAVWVETQQPVTRHTLVARRIRPFDQPRPEPIVAPPVAMPVPPAPDAATVNAPVVTEPQRVSGFRKFRRRLRRLLKSDRG